MNIEMALKSRSYILDLDHVKLYLGIFFFLSCLIDSISHQLSGSTFIFVKNTHQKAANLVFSPYVLRVDFKGLISSKVSSWFIALQVTSQDSLPQVKLGKTLNLRLFGVCF